MGTYPSPKACSSLAVYQDYFVTAEQVAAHAKQELTVPVRAYGGVACLGDVKPDRMRNFRARRLNETAPYPNGLAGAELVATSAAAGSRP